MSKGVISVMLGCSLEVVILKPSMWTADIPISDQTISSPRIAGAVRFGPLGPTP